MEVSSRCLRLVAEPHLQVWLKLPLDLRNDQDGSSFNISRTQVNLALPGEALPNVDRLVSIKRRKTAWAEMLEMLRQTTIARNGFLLLHELGFRVQKRTVPIDALKGRRRRPPEFAESRVLVQSCH